MSPTPDAEAPGSRRRRLRAAVTALAVTGLLASCGGSEGEPPLSETLPACEDVWVAGKPLPADYAGCRDDEGVLQVTEIQECTRSEERLAQFDTQHFALLGHEVYDDGEDSPAYQEVYESCFGAGW